MTLPRDLALAELQHYASVATSDTASDMEKAIARRELKKACDHPKYELAWEEAKEFLSLVTVSKGAAGGAGLNLKDCTDGEGAGGVWLPKWTTPVGRDRGFKLAMAILAKAGYAVQFDAPNGSFTATLSTSAPAWVPQTVGERLMKTR